MSSRFSSSALAVLRAGNILPDGLDPEALINQVLDTILGAEEAFHSPASVVGLLKAEANAYIADKLFMFGTPTLTNAVRPGVRPLSSCACVPVDLRLPLSVAASSIEAYYEQNMGSGFALDSLNDPVSTVVALNNHARQLTKAGRYERYIGNMANLRVDHPGALDFVTLKARQEGLSHFNLSVNVTERFMSAALTDDTNESAGDRMGAQRMWNAIVDSAWRCGDPGLVFLERFNADNPAPTLGPYVTTAPCAEVPLAEGETCVFGYINLAEFGHRTRDGWQLKHELLHEVVRVLTRLLDDALELSIDCYPTDMTRTIMAAKRRIAIGICGYADLLVRLGIPYGSAASIEVLEELLIRISYASKVASMDLAAERGSFLAFPDSRYATSPDLLSRKFGLVDTSSIDSGDWCRLETKIRRTGQLRNAVTTALPPSGRTAVLLDASTSLEPWFSVLDNEGNVRWPLIEYVHKEYGGEPSASSLLQAIATKGTSQLPGLVPEPIRQVATCATEVPPLDHLRVVAAATRCIDESASKTINLPSTASSKDVARIFEEAWRRGLKAISIYRDRSIPNQPELLGGVDGNR